MCPRQPALVRRKRRRIRVHRIPGNRTHHFPRRQIHRQRRSHVADRQQQMITQKRRQSRVFRRLQRQHRLGRFHIPHAHHRSSHRRSNQSLVGRDRNRRPPC